MTTAVKIQNVGSHDIVMNVWQTDSPASEGQNVERYDLGPGAETQPITIFGWRRGVTVLESCSGETPVIAEHRDAPLNIHGGEK